MDFLPIAVGVGVGVAVIGGAVILIASKGKKGKEEEVEEIIEEEAPSLISVKEEDEETGCPEAIKAALLKNQERIFQDAHKVYLVIANTLRNKNLPPELKAELDNFLRAYNRIRELREEIEVYPFSDCHKVFQLKFNFYNKLIKETAHKIMAMARTLK